MKEKGYNIKKNIIFELIKNKGDPLPANINLFDIMVKVRVIVVNAAFNNISVISRRSALLMEKT